MPPLRKKRPRSAETDVASFRRDGFVVLRGVLSEDQLAELAADCAAAAAAAAACAAGSTQPVACSLPLDPWHAARRDREAYFAARPAGPALRALLLRTLPECVKRATGWGGGCSGASLGGGSSGGGGSHQHSSEQQPPMASLMTPSSQQLMLFNEHYVCKPGKASCGGDRFQH